MALNELQMVNLSGPESMSTAQLLESVKHPQDEGVFPIDGYEGRIKSIETLRTTEYSARKTVVGQITTREVVMTDGSEYITKTGEPVERTTDVATVMTTALFTKIGGINKRMMLALMREGMPVDFISTEQRFNALGIGRSGHNMLQITRALQEEHEQEEGLASYGGISQGAMKGMAYKALSESNGIYVAYSDLIVPCFNEALSWELIKELRRQPGNELNATKRHIVGIALSHLFRYRKTLDISPNGINSAFRSIPILTSGEAGMFGRLIPKKDTNMYLRTFKGDIVSQGDKWEEDFADYPGVVVDNDKVDETTYGGHADCISEATYQDWLTRQRALRDELVRVGTNVADIDYKKIDPRFEKAA